MCVACDCRCGGTGLVRVHSHEDYGVSFESEACDCLVGRGRICEDGSCGEADEHYRLRGVLKRIADGRDAWAAGVARDALGSGDVE
jgi:hypothetical protein